MSTSIIGDLRPFFVRKIDLSQPWKYEKMLSELKVSVHRVIRERKREVKIPSLVKSSTQKNNSYFRYFFLLHNAWVFLKRNPSHINIESLFVNIRRVLVPSMRYFKQDPIDERRKNDERDKPSLRVQGWNTARNKNLVRSKLNISSLRR